jgi:hypothetical protein
MSEDIMAKYLLKRLLRRDKLNRLLRERLTEPIHLNILSAFVALFGTFRLKVEFDLVVRHQYAFSLLRAAEFAQVFGISSLTAIEFGVANGAGLLNMCHIAARVTKATGIRFQVFGFDTGAGMPPPRDYRDMPEGFKEGFFPMTDRAKLLKALPPNAQLVLGDIDETTPEFLKTVSRECPIGFVAVDVDYYWSAKSCLKVLAGQPEQYLPMTLVYLDDISVPNSNPWVGELLAINEFNAENKYRKIAPYTLLRGERIFKQTRWIDQIFVMHTLDHEIRNSTAKPKDTFVIDNPYL